MEALGYNALARDKAPEGVDPASWHLARCRELLARLVDTSFDSQFPTDGITKAFADPVCVEAFLSFVTRDPTALGDVQEDFMDRRYFKPHTFSTVSGGAGEDGVELKRAYRTTNVLHSLADYPTAVLSQVCVAKSEIILSSLFRAFRAENSPASVFHLCKVLEAMIKLSPSKAVEYLVEGQRLKLCLTSLIANTHCSVVVDLLCNLFRMPLVRDTNAGVERLRLVDTLPGELKKHFQRRLGLVDPVQLLINNLPGDLAEGSVEVLTQLLGNFELNIMAKLGGEMAVTEQTLKPLSDSNNVDKLVRLATAESNSFALALLVQLAKLAATGRLNNALVSGGAGANGAEAEDEDLPRKKPTNIKTARAASKAVQHQQQAERDAQSKLSKLRQELQQVFRTKRHLALLCASLESAEDDPKTLLKHTSYVCNVSFSYHRMELLRTVGFLVELTAPDKTSTAATAPAIVPWKQLIQWQGAYPQNSLLQHEFCRLLQFTLLHREDELKQAMGERKLLSQLIRRAKESNDTDHAHAMQCLNLLRLKQDLLAKVLTPKLLHKHWLVQYLKSHSGWMAFQPELKRATQRTFRAVTQEEPGAATAIHDMFQKDPDNPLNQGVMELTSSLAEQEQSNVDIELGSEFAKLLGFTPQLIQYETKRALEADDGWADEDPAPKSASKKNHHPHNANHHHHSNSNSSSSGKKKKKN